ncbi:MAG: type IVB secretion system protein IcmH/DotU [Proteobacteria bacterium]|nr:type IVB secretion system protein IcmH/DotU [Pseudomonadota bacterium]
MLNDSVSLTQKDFLIDPPYHSQDEVVVGSEQDSTNVYYRSRLFNANTGTNLLTTAAAPFFVLSEQLKKMELLPDLQLLQYHLAHEFKVFESRGRMSGYPAETLFIARYLICCLLDEILRSKPNSYQLFWSCKQLFANAPSFSQEDDPFFAILDKLSKDPTNHIDSLELIYMLLISGFSGNYQTMPHGKMYLDEKIDHLYQLIRTHRGDFKKDVFIANVINKKHKLLEKPLPLLLMITFAFTIIVSVYTQFNYLLDLNSKPFSEKLNKIVKQVQQVNHDL